MSRQKGIPNRYHPPEFKLELVKEVLSGKSPRVVGQAHNVNEGVVRRWVSQYRRDGEAALENKRGGGSPAVRRGGKKDLSYVEQLEYELAKAKVEIAKLKKDVELERRCRSPKK